MSNTYVGLWVVDEESKYSRGGLNSSSFGLLFRIGKSFEWIVPIHGCGSIDLDNDNDDDDDNNIDDDGIDDDIGDDDDDDDDDDDANKEEEDLSFTLTLLILLGMPKMPIELLYPSTLWDSKMDSNVDMRRKRNVEQTMCFPCWLVFLSPCPSFLSLVLGVVDVKESKCQSAVIYFMF